MSDSPSWLEVLDELAEGREIDTHVVKVGKVVSWNKDEQTANIEVQVNPPDDTAYPMIQNAKVVFPGVYWDIQVGEYGLVLIGDWDINRWWRTGEKTTPESVEPHAIQNATFLPGIRTKTGARTIPTGATVLRSDDLRLGNNGLASIADEKAMRGDAFTGDLSLFMSDLSTWVSAVSTATGVSGTNLLADITTITVALAAGSYLSDEVKVS